MIYKYNKTSLNYTNITHKLGIFMFGFILVTISLGYVFRPTCDYTKFISEETKAIIIKEHNEFSKEKLRAYIATLKLKCPEIVMAQAEIESAHFTSHIFKENNNLFGMKQAGIGRPCTAKGTANNHAYYETWQECVQDYAFYQAAFLKNIKTQEQYLQYIGENYAEDSSYINKIKTQLNLENTK